MRFTVIWKPQAEAELANLWLSSQSPRDVAKAADLIDHRLASDPERAGEAFYGDWLLVEWPLAVVFTFSQDDRRVDVIQVWHQ